MFRSAATQLNQFLARITSGITDGLVLLGSDGKTETVYHSKKKLDGSYTRAKCLGTRSFYICYDQENFADGSNSMIVENVVERDLGRPIKSLQGYDKKGLILFPHANYCGEATFLTKDDPDITDQFVQGTEEGAVSLVVHRGMWALYSEPHHQGARVTIEGKDSFGPGTFIPSGKLSDQVGSVKLL